MTLASINSDTHILPVFRYASVTFVTQCVLVTSRINYYDVDSIMHVGMSFICFVRTSINDHVMELLIMAYACKTSSANRIVGK